MKLRAAYLVALLAACTPGAEREPAAARSDPGGGPITPTPYVEESYKRFLNKRDPMIFVLSEDGKAAFYKFCRSSGDCDDVRARADALSGCEDKAGGVPCRIYYQAPKGVVWDGPPVLGLATPAAPE
ncbi:MAG: hypothetical protein QNJ30_27645 [Kiloniellales bacterium]|nr:hypothetical protein [Kiloniellales bacterium]